MTVSKRSNQKSLALAGLLFLIALGTALHMTRAWRPSEPFYLCAGLGLLMVVFGVTLPAVDTNSFYGVRTSWTLSSPDVWRETHRVVANVYLIAGLACIGAAIVFDPAIIALATIVTVIFVSLFGIDYSRRVAQRMSGSAAH
jgi:uncharacterized membrane protein